MADIPKRVANKIAEKYTQDRNTFKRAVADRVEDRIEHEIGDGKQDVFLPQAKIMRWDNEVNFSLRYKDDTPERAEVQTEGDRVKYIKPDREVHFYDLDSGEVGEDGGLEIELVLKEKPVTNVFEFTIETKDVEFIRIQSILEEAETDKRIVRATGTEGYDKDGRLIVKVPEYLVGGYALYTKTYKKTFIGGKKYGNNKIGNIQRPKIYDKNGSWAWGELHIDEENKLLTITVDQSFLDSAVYPVIVDPTFGYTTFGGTSDSWYSGDMSFFGPETLTEDGTAEKMTAAIFAQSGSVNIKAVVYEHEAGALVDSSGATSVDSTGQWNDFTLSAFLTAGDYDLGGTWDGGVWFLRDGGATGFTRYYNDTQNNYTVVPDPANTMTPGADRRGSAYVTYVAGTPTIEQEGFAFGDDDDTESAHTLHTQDANVTEPIGTKTLRTILDSTNDYVSSVFKLKYQKNGSGGYVDVPIGSQNVTSVEYVGSTRNGAANGSDVTLNLSLISGLSEGDIVILAYTIGDNDNLNFSMAISSGTGWTLEEDLFSNDTYDSNLGVFWKIMGATPDTSVTVSGLGGSDSSTAAVAMAFRGVDQTTPFDVSPTTSTGLNSGNPNPPSISHNGAEGMAVVAIGASAHAAGSINLTPPTNYDTSPYYSSWYANDTSDCSIGVACNFSPSNPEDPGVFTLQASDSTSYAWTAVTIALRPVAATDNEVYVSTSSNVASGGEATTARLTAPSGKTTGDFTTGRRWDDENGSDSIDIAADNYTELEWVLTTQDLVTDDYIEFRVYDEDTALDTYTLTPKWTIGSGGGGEIVKDMIGGFIPFPR